MCLKEKNATTETTKVLISSKTFSGGRLIAASVHTIRPSPANTQIKSRNKALGFDQT